MSQNQRPANETRITMEKLPEYRDSYANSVQVRLSVWDFFLVFGTLQQQAPDQVRIDNFQGVYLSPQQAKALTNVLSANVASYEQTFGEISLDGSLSESVNFNVPSGGPVH